MGTDGAVHTFHHIQLGTTVLTCHGTGACSADSPTEFYNNILNTTQPFGGFSALETVLSANGGNTQPATTDVLDSEATQILAAGLPQVYKWDVNGLTDAHTQDNPALAADAGNLTGAFKPIELAAQTLVPASSLGIRSVSDILYGQDQLPTSLTGPNNPVSVFQALAAGTGTQTLDKYASVQQGRLAQLELLLNVVLAAQQAAVGRFRRRLSQQGLQPGRQHAPDGYHRHGRGAGADLQRAGPTGRRRRAGHRQGDG